MKCRHFEDNLPDWISNRVSEDLARQMLAHAASCESCSRMSEEERGLRSAWRSLPVPVETPDIWPQLAARIRESDAATVRTGGWRSWFALPTGSLRYGLAGLASAVVIMAVVLNKPAVNPTSYPPVVANTDRQAAANDNSDNYVQLVSDRQSLPDAEGDLAIGRTPRYRQAERIVLGHSANE